MTRGGARWTAQAALPLLLAGLLAAASCGPPASGPEAARDSVRFPIPTDPSSLAYTRANDTVSVIVDELIGCPLVAWSRELEPVPRAAESWTLADDGRTVRFHLRGGLTWHDGTPVTSRDVVNTFEQLSAPEAAGSSFADGFGAVSGVEVVDELTVDVTYEEVFSRAVSIWTSPLVPAHRPADDPEPLGCGPWRLAGWQRGQRIVLEANPDHVSGPPPLERLELEILADYSTRFAAFRAGNVDMCGLLPAHWKTLREIDGWQQRWEVAPYHVLFFWYVAWRMDGSNPFFEDGRVRLAMTHAIDREGMLESLFDGDGIVATTSFHPDTWAYDHSLKPWPFSPPRARELLDEAGWTDPDGDGTREREGQEFRFTLSFPQTSAETEKIATLVQAQLAEVGVVVELEPLEWAVFLERTRQGAFEAMMSGRRLGPAPDPHDLWHSSQASGGANYAALRDAEIDRLIETARRTVDRDEQRTLYHRIQRRLHELQPDTFFFYPTSRLAWNQEIVGVEVGPLGPLRAWPGPAAWRWAADGAAEP